MIWLPDGNVLVALVLDSHVHHDRAHRWFASVQSQKFATCVLTQGTLLRAHMRATADPGPDAAWRALASVIAHPRHVWWGNDMGFADVPHRHFVRALRDQLDTLNLEGKIVALYGMGDQLGYGEWFLDALGMLHDKLATKGVKFVGYWPTEGYEFTSPKPVIADGQLFVGLALDETNQYDLSDERIQSWCEQILGEMAEHFS